MARIVPLKNDIATPGNSNGPKLSKAAIGVVLQDGTISVTEQGKFFLNPDSWEENKQSNWIPHQIPGQSDPIMQWVNGGPRMISFDALVTRDIGDAGSSDLKSQLKNAALNAVGSIASSFFGVNVPPINDLLGGESNKSLLSVEDSLNFYRSLLYPMYDKKGRVKNSPPLVVLFVGSSLQNRTIHLSKDEKISQKNHVWVVTNLRIKITKQLLNLDPMEALVSFQLIEYPMKSKDQTSFAADFNSAGLSIF